MRSGLRSGLKRIRTVFFFGLLIAVQAKGAETPYISVGQARTKKVVVAFPSIQATSKITESLGKKIADTISGDLSFMDMFKMLGPAAYIEDPSKAGITPNSFKFSDWSSIGSDFLIKASLAFDASASSDHGPDSAIVFEVHLYDIASQKQVLAKRYIAPQKEIKLIAHTFANEFVETLTGLPGIFLTKIAMTCDLTGKKEIYMMNFDGSEVKQVTHHRSLAFAPAWSPDGTRIAYSLYTRHAGNIKNIDLYEFDFRTNTIRPISTRRGINSGAAYSPDGKKIAATLSFKGNPEIFVLDPALGTASQITKSFGFDVDPVWSPKGGQLAFVSSRTGIPMVFTMKADGSQVQRLTFAGRYNATPSWSPRMNKIAFAGWIEKGFDIFIMNPDGTTIERLTKNQGNNEDPFFSPDGNFITFSSNRTGQKAIYTMNVDGTVVKRLTYGLGNCVAPKWSNPPPTRAVQ